MREKINISTLRPFVFALVAYLAIVLFYFAPQFRGDVIVQGDVTQYRGMAQEIVSTRESEGVDPQWTGSMFGGMPAYMIDIKYPAQIVKSWVGSVVKIIDTPAAFIFFAMLSMWLMLVMMGVNGYVAIVGGAMFGLSTYFMLIIEAGHLTKMWALVYAPAMMGAIFVSLRRGVLWGYALTALFASLQIGANHPQITYYFLVAAAAFWLSELYFVWREGGLKEFARRTAFVGAAGVLALLSNLSPMWYAAEHTADTIRGGSELVESSESGDSGLDLEYATAWSYGRAESFNMLIPNFMGSDSARSFEVTGEVGDALQRNGIDRGLAKQLPLYWGTQPFTSGPTYLGAVVLFLAFVGFGLSRGRERWWIVGVSLFMIFLAWGSNMMWFTQLMFDLLPGYNKFRTVSMTLVVVEWTAPLLASYALMRMWSGEWQRRELTRVVALSAALTAGVALLFVVAGGAIFDFGYRESFEMLLNASLPEQMASDVARAMAADRVTFMIGDALRTAIFVLLVVGAILLFVIEKISRVVMLIVVGVLCVVDLVGVDMRYLSHDDFTEPHRTRVVATAADREIMADKGESGEREYRVFNLSVSPFNDASTSYFHRSVGGYHGAKLSRYQDIIDNYLSYQDPAVLDMLNTRYTITREGDVVLRDSAAGAAWFVSQALRAATPRDEIDALAQVDLRSVAIVGEDQNFKGRGFAMGEIVMEEYQPHYQRYKYSADAPSTVIFSEIYYNKGWRAYVDGEEVPYLRANYILRAMELPEGEHTIEWRFRAPRWGLIEGITLIASIAILLLMMITILRKIYETKQKIEE